MKKLFTLTLLLCFLFGNKSEAQVTNGLIQHFKFDNSYANEAGNVSFSSTSFTTDREGVPNSAIVINTTTLQSQATIPGLPYGNAARTVSFWVKASSFSGLNYDPVFTYGTGTASNSFGGSFCADRIAIIGHTNNATTILGFGNLNVVGTWYQVTLSYDGTNAKIYRNGVLINTQAMSWNTINNSNIFKLGIGAGGEKFFNGAIDDLKIFDRAISDSEASLLYNGNIDVCSNLLSYFSFDNNTTDHTGTTNFTTTDGVYPVTRTIGRAGGSDYALQTIQAATQPRTISIPEMPVGNASRTIAFWMKTTTPFSTSQSFFTYGTNGNAQTFGLYNNSSGELIFQGYGAGNDVATGATIGQNAWVQIALVFNKYLVKVYTNGVLRHSFTPSTALNTGSSAFKIGSFNGAIDDLSIYDRALTFGEIEALYNNSALTCPVKPIISNTASTVNGINTATISYSIRGINQSTTSLIKYGLNEFNLNNQIAGHQASGNAVTPGSVTINGLQAGSKYYYQIEATNINGTSTVKGSFTLYRIVAEYTFNNTYNNTNGENPFSNTNTTFTTDRYGNINAALNRTVASTASSTATNINDIPIGASARTVSLWINSNNTFNNINGNTIFSYGGNTGTNPNFLLYFDFNTGGLALATGSTYNSVANSPIIANQWYHIVVSYDGAASRVYLNGSLKLSTLAPLNTANNFFSLGNFTGSMDDLRIYDYAMPDTEILSLYNTYVTLPVSLKHFTAKAQNNTALLNWETLSETNNSHFIINRSSNGVDYEQLQTITAKSAIGAKYQFTDYSPLTGTNYYQLLQVDLDGKTTELGVKAVNFALENNVSIKVYPNPATQKVNLNFEPDTFENVNLFDLTGKLLTSYKLQNSESTKEIDVSLLPKGIYILQLSGKGKSVSERIVKD